MHAHSYPFFEDTPPGGPRQCASQGLHPQQSHHGMCNKELELELELNTLPMAVGTRVKDGASLPKQARVRALCGIMQ